MKKLSESDALRSAWTEWQNIKQVSSNLLCEFVRSRGGRSSC